MGLKPTHISQVGLFKAALNAYVKHLYSISISKPASQDFLQFYIYMLFFWLLHVYDMFCCGSWTRNPNPFRRSAPAIDGPEGFIMINLTPLRSQNTQNNEYMVSYTIMRLCATEIDSYSSIDFQHLSNIFAF